MILRDTKLRQIAAKPALTSLVENRRVEPLSVRRTGNPPFSFTGGALLYPIVIYDYQFVNSNIHGRGVEDFER